EINRIINELKTLKDKNKILTDENQNLQNIDEKCKKLAEENEKLFLINKELTEKNDELVLKTFENNNLFIYEELNKGLTETLQNINKKINNSLSLLKINFLDSDENKIDKIILAKNKRLENENNQILENNQYEKLLKKNQKLQKENEVAVYQNQRLTEKLEQVRKEIDEKVTEYNKKNKIFNILNEKIDIILDNFSFEIIFPLNDTIEKMEKIVELCELNRIQKIINDLKKEKTLLENTISVCKNKIKDYEQNKTINQDLKNLEYEYNSVERSLKNILEQIEKERKSISKYKKQLKY
ncbi:37093_t:CDS:2, partial [Racocetra persica]